jgi:hypothetical protein
VHFRAHCRFVSYVLASTVYALNPGPEATGQNQGGIRISVFTLSDQQPAVGFEKERIGSNLD